MLHRLSGASESMPTRTVSSCSYEAKNDLLLVRLPVALTTQGTDTKYVLKDYAPADGIGGG